MLKNKPNYKLKSKKHGKIANVFVNFILLTILFNIVINVLLNFPLVKSLSSNNYYQNSISSPVSSNKIVKKSYSSPTQNAEENNSDKLEIPSYQNYVNDFAGVISEENRQKLNSYLKELEAKTTAQVAVVTLPTLKGNAIEDISLEIGRKWGVGQKDKDNGVVILVVPQDKEMRIEVGYGLEGAVPDGKAGRIRDSYMLPYFKQGDMETGIVNGTVAVAAVIAQSYGVTMPEDFNQYVSSLPESYSSDYSGASPINDSNIIFYIILFIIIMSILSGGRGMVYTGWGGGFGDSGGGGFGGFGGGGFGGGGSSGRW